MSNQENFDNLENKVNKLILKVIREFGIETIEGVPAYVRVAGGLSKSSKKLVGFNSNILSLTLDNEHCLREEYNHFGFRETIITLYTNYL